VGVKFTWESLNPRVGGCGLGVTGAGMRQKVGRDVPDAPLEVRGGPGGPALPEKREPPNTMSYWGEAANHRFAVARYHQATGTTLARHGITLAD
jgi:hypothetical protein